MNLLKSLFYLPRNDRIGIAVIVVLVCVSLMVVTILGNDSAVTDKGCDMKENPAAVVHKEKTAVYHVAGREYGCSRLIPTQQTAVSCFVLDLLRGRYAAFTDTGLPAEHICARRTLPDCMD